MQIKRGVKIFIIAFVVAVLLGLFVINSTAFTCWDFRNNLWGPSYLLVHNESPYRVDKLFDLGNAVWMPMAVGLFFPLGFLSLQQASNLWFVFNLFWFLLIVWISSGSRRPSIFLFAIVLLLSFLFPPLVTHLWSGQITILITLVFLIIATWDDELSALKLATLLAVGLSKPQLAILALPGFMFYRIKKYEIQGAALLGVLLMCSILILTIPLFIAYPGWFPDFLSEIQQNPSWAHPSSLNFLRNALPNSGEVIWILLAVFVFIVNTWLWRALPGREAVYWSLALTPLVTPYVWTWDFVILLPLFISTLFRMKSKFSMGVLLTSYLLLWALITNMKIQDEVYESHFWWIPWLMISVVIAGRLVENRLELRAYFSNWRDTIADKST